MHGHCVRRRHILLRDLASFHGRLYLLPRARAGLFNLISAMEAASRMRAAMPACMDQPGMVVAYIIYSMLYSNGINCLVTNLIPSYLFALTLNNIM